MASRSGTPLPGVPVELTSFVGRRQDLAAVRQLCGIARLVTVTGIGGVGKTRLAVRVAGELRRAFPDGLYVVELAALTDPSLLPHAVLDALGVQDQPTRPPLTVIAEHLRSRHMMLLLDNCEHLVDAVAELADHVLRGAPEVRILATSRQALRIAGEYVYPLSPLPAPHPETTIRPGTALQYPSVMLLVERSTAVVPDFALTPENEAAVVRLCQRLEGIPLAIELAAVRLKVLTVEQLVSRLDDRFELLSEGSRNLPRRHQTLQALIDWSHDLCDADERTLWARASVFVGSFALDALETVCTDEALPTAAVLNTVAGLVDKSIFQREVTEGGARFRMLETLRSYGQDRLTAAGQERELARRHRDWCLEMVERAGDEWVGPRQQEWASRLELDHANIRRALEFCVSEPGEARAGLRLAAVPWLWGATSHLNEGYLWLRRTLALDEEPSHERAWALATAAYVATFERNLEALHTLPEEALALAQQLDDPAAIAYAKHVLGTGRALGPDPGSAIPLLTEALQGYLDCGVPAQYPDSLLIELAAAHLFHGDIDIAADIVDRLLEQCTANGDLWNLSYALWGRGYIAVLRGQPETAEEDLRTALRIKQQLHDTLGVAFALELLAWAAVHRDAERSATLFGAADRLWETVVGSPHLADQRKEHEAIARAQLSGPAFDLAFGRGRGADTETIVTLALGDSTPPVGAATPSTPAVSLTRRQREVAEMVAAGMSNKDIAARLVISLRTAEGHVEGILTKLGFTSRAQIATWMSQQEADER
ncbi:LuxR C-terminal-related transcriptional regulator [Nocardioides sp. LS1]|uniref:ATP-binding protein n=1 Tax=Nocardioides sp. LS1 TaxID=1027620 RepID=UPI000F625FEB|nr:LuxR C-terminal-related transcriptional regulator [Nocardioides sp. LS1]GCD88110.1 LuxR family transcriptional regulator [Nocardioides sp. LS1]